MDNKSKSNVAVEKWFEASGYRHKVIISSILISLVIFGGLGVLVDYFANSKPAGFIIGVIISFVVSQVFIYKKLSQYTKKLLDK